VSLNVSSRPALLPEDEGVLILTSAAEEQQIMQALDQAGIRTESCGSIREVCRSMESGAGVLIASRALEHRVRQFQKLTLEQSKSEDRERHRLSEILHDDLQQVLVAAKFHLAKLGIHIPDSSSKAIAAQIESILGDAIQKSRTLSQELSPTVLHRANFAEILRWLAGQIQAMHGLELELEISRELQIESSALRWFLYKAINELLLNIAKHARTSRARIRARRIRKHICVSVLDQGRGLDTSELDEGAGLGLTGIGERLELLGGRLAIRSAGGKGRSFRIVIPEDPFADEKSTEKRVPDKKEPDISFGNDLARLRVLIADDHEIVREGIASLLSEQKDVEVVAQAGNGREAVDLAGQFRPDVVIMDASMPLMNGDEATRQIKTYLPNTRVVALSMFDQNEMIQRMYRAGVEGYVLKTAPPEDLLAAIRSREQASN
jgi:signal transduction histidine kinase/ActR/RegA family two-component response regulator